MTEIRAELGYITTAGIRSVSEFTSGQTGVDAITFVCFDGENSDLCTEMGCAN